jgi:hypothetical protein
VFTLAADLANPQSLWEQILGFLTDFDAMFPGFTAVVGKAQKPFFLVAFVLIVYHLIKRLSGHGSREAQLRAIASAAVFSLLVALCNKEANLIKEAFIALETEIGATSKTPKLIEQKKEEMIVALTKGIEDKSGNSGGAGDDKGSLYYLTHWGAAMEKGIEGIVPSIGGLIIQLGSWVLIFWCKFASLIAWGFWLVQQFLFQFSLIFLPAMVALIAVGGLSSIGTRYVMSIIGLLSWPLGWAFVNVGTEAMLTAIVNTLKSSSASDYELTTYLWAYAICTVIPLWIILGYCFVPFVIQRMVMSGANAAQGLIGQAAGAAIGAAALGAGIAATSGQSSGGGSQVSAGSSSGASAGAGSNSESSGGGTAPFRNPQRSASTATAALGAIAAVSSMASAPFDQLAQDAGAAPMSGSISATSPSPSSSGEAPTLVSRIQQSQAMAASAPPPLAGLTPSSAAARDEVERRRGTI